MGAGKTVVRLRQGARELLAVAHAEVPCEKNLQVNLAEGAVLTFVDSRGVERAYDFVSALAEGDRYFGLSVRIAPGFALMADGLLAGDTYATVGQFTRGERKGIRLQPVYLPECDGDPNELIGKGMFFRGLHYPGHITQGNVSLLCRCDHCAKSFRLQGFHAGFSHAGYLYCSKGPHLLWLDGQEWYPSAYPNPALDKAVREQEPTLPPCAICGGQFAWMNSLRCPHCRAAFIDFEKFPALRYSEYYGQVEYGLAAQHWTGGA